MTAPGGDDDEGGDSGCGGCLALIIFLILASLGIWVLVSIWKAILS